MRKILIACSFLFVASGCVLSADRELNELNRQAGELIAAQATQPDIAEIGADIAAAAAQIQVESLPKPDRAVTYSHEVVAATIEASKQEIPGEGLLNLISPWLGFAGLAGAGEAVRRLLKNRKAIKQAYDVYFNTVDVIKTTARTIKDAENRPLTGMDVKLLAEQAQKSAGIGEQIAKLYADWKVKQGEKT